MKILCVAWLSAVVLIGCASSGSTPAPAGSTPVSIPPLTVVRTGGIAGVDDTLRIGADGSWSLTDKTGQTKSGTLSAADIAALTPLATDPRLAAEAAAPTVATACRDAFNYVVTAAGAHVSYTDCPADAHPPVATIALVQKLFALTGN